MNQFTPTLGSNTPNSNKLPHSIDSNFQKLNLKSANRKRKSSLANIAQVQNNLKKTHLPSINENQQHHHPRPQLASHQQQQQQQTIAHTPGFFPSSLPYSELRDVFSESGLSNVNENTQSKLGFPIFTKQFIEHHSAEEQKLTKVGSAVEQQKNQLNTLRNQSTQAFQQIQVCEKRCKELQSNNAQLVNYLQNARKEFLPLLIQLEQALGTSPLPKLEFRTTDELNKYLLTLGKKIWESPEVADPNAANPAAPPPNVPAPVDKKV